MRRIRSILVVFSLLCTSVLAVEVDPMRVEEAVSLGQPAQAELKVSNPLDHAVGVQLSAGPYRSPQPEMKVPSAESWLHFDPARFTLAPNASTTVQIRFEPPAAVSSDTAGEYLAAILIDQLPAEEPAETPQGSRVTVIPRLAIPVYLRIQGRERVEVELADVSLKIAQGLAQGASGEPAPELLRIDTSLRNRGTVHVRLTGTFALFRQDGQLVRSGPLGKTAPLLSSATLVLPTLFPLPAPGRYKLALTLESGSDPLRPEEAPPGASAHRLLQKEVPFEITGDGRIVQEKK